MNFNSLRKEIISNNASVKELVNEFFAKIGKKDPKLTHIFVLQKIMLLSKQRTLIT